MNYTAFQSFLPAQKTYLIVIEEKFGRYFLKWEELKVIIGWEVDQQLTEMDRLSSKQKRQILVVWKLERKWTVWIMLIKLYLPNKLLFCILLTSKKWNSLLHYTKRIFYVFNLTLLSVTSQSSFLPLSACLPEDDVFGSNSFGFSRMLYSISWIIHYLAMFVLDFFHVAYCFWVSSMLSHHSLHSFLSLRVNSLYGAATICFSICELMDIWIVSIFDVINKPATSIHVQILGCMYVFISFE